MLIQARVNFLQPNYELLQNIDATNKICKTKSEINNVNNHDNGQSQRATDASVKFERNPAFCEGRETCKQFCFKKFAQKQKMLESLPQMKLQSLNTLNLIQGAPNVKLEPRQDSNISLPAIQLAEHKDFTCGNSLQASSLKHEFC